jgi:spermidine synthase
VAVEYDEKVLELGARYFNSDKYEAVKIVCADAYQFVMEAKESYDLIVIDLYDDLDVPPQFETSDFISAVCSLLNPLGMLFFNKVVMNAEHKRAYKLAEAEYQKYGSSETYVLMEMNYMLALTRTINE